MAFLLPLAIEGIELAGAALIEGGVGAELVTDVGIDVEMETEFGLGAEEAQPLLGEGQAAGRTWDDVFNSALNSLQNASQMAGDAVGGWVQEASGSSFLGNVAKLGAGAAVGTGIGYAADEARKTFQKLGPGVSPTTIVPLPHTPVQGQPTSTPPPQSGGSIQGQASTNEEGTTVDAATSEAPAPETTPVPAQIPGSMPQHYTIPDVNYREYADQFAKHLSDAQGNSDLMDLLQRAQTTDYADLFGMWTNNMQKQVPRARMQEYAQTFNQLVRVFGPQNAGRMIGDPRIWQSDKLAAALRTIPNAGTYKQGFRDNPNQQNALGKTSVSVDQLARGITDLHHKMVPRPVRRGMKRMQRA